MQSDAPRSCRWLTLLALVMITLLYLWSHRACFGDDHRLALTQSDEPLPARIAGDVLIVSPLYVASLNPDTKFCDWVQYTLTPGLLDTGNVLSRNWRTKLRDEALEDADYTGSAYDRGHLVPLASVSASPWACDVNRLEVVAPQTPDLNRGVWLKLEARCRDLVHEQGRLSVQVGTLYESDMPPLPAADEPHTVPSHYWLRIVSAAGTECYLVPQTAARDAAPDQYALDERTLRGRVKCLQR